MIKSVNINNKARIEYLDDLIFRYTFLTNIDLKTANNVTFEGDKMGGNFLVCANLVDIRSAQNISSEVREYFGEQTRKNLAAIAIIIESKIQSKLANLYLKINSPKTNTQIFTNTSDAEKWLKKQIANF